MALRGPDASRIALVVMTLTDNGEAGQRVSMDHLARTASLCREHSVPLFLDAARFAENAWLVTQHEAACRDMSPRQVAEQAFRLADGCLMSAKKDGIVHIGGFLGLRDHALAERCELLLIATEGFEGGPGRHGQGQGTDPGLPPGRTAPAAPPLPQQAGTGSGVSRVTSTKMRLSCLHHSGNVPLAAMLETDTGSRKGVHRHPLGR
ncbi:beta-eliminating lyase-related protein [Streptomyces iakyrus]|uniref:beta-eliminating lyase-related protein n=1 Tax=Streptomyces iakyrus TaxID=68219 RepID=UPI003816B45F